MKKKVNRGVPNYVIWIGVAGFVILAFILFVLFSVGLSAGSFLPGQQVAIIPLKGEISNSIDVFDSALSADEIVKLIDEADSNPSVGAILIDIDSPGGEVIASKQIVYKLREVEKPTFSYIGSLGASGAYYVAAATDYIMLDEDSITGSIGVISIFTNFTELLEKVGIGVIVLKEGKFKDMGSPFKDLTEEEREIMQSILNQVYNGFRDDVLEFRQGKISSSELDSVADGRILSGKQAYEKNLVDELIQKDKVRERIGELAGLDNPVFVTYYKETPSLYEFIFSSGRAFGSGFLNSLKISDRISIR